MRRWMQKNTLGEGPLLILSLRWVDQKMMRFLYLNWNVKQHFYSLPILFMCMPRNWQDKISQQQFNFLPVRPNGLKRKAVFHSARTQKFIAKCIERCGQRASYHNLLPHRCAGMRAYVRIMLVRTRNYLTIYRLRVCSPRGLSIVVAHSFPFWITQRWEKKSNELSHEWVNILFYVKY